MNKDERSSKRQIDLYLDGELKGDNKENFANKVKKDPKLAAMVKNEEYFRNFIRKHAAKSPSASDLEKNIKANLGKIAES